MNTTIWHWFREEAEEVVGTLKAGVSAYLEEERVASLRNNRRGSVRCSEKEGRVLTLIST